MIRYGNGSNTLFGGVQWKPAAKLELGIQLAWSEAEAALDSQPVSSPAAARAISPP